MRFRGGGLAAAMRTACRSKKRMAARILGAYECEHLEMVEFIEKFPDLQETPAQFQERCAQIALKCFWTASAQQMKPRGGFLSDLVARLRSERSVQN